MTMGIGGAIGDLPAGFRWGVATAAYQIEGAVNEDGRGVSIWDTFTHEPDHVADDSTGDVACDHYHRYAEDVALMADLGVNAYRFSIAWPRIQPEGTGPANRAGVAFYDRLVDALLARGIDPTATLLHWDLPQALQDQGGWTNRETALRFADYADLMGAALGDRVSTWLTLNEAAVTTSMGHLWGIHAPGLHLFDDPFPVAHHQLLAHGLAVAALRTHTSALVGIANNYSPSWAVGPDGQRDSATEADRAAAAAYDAFHNHLYTDPPLVGRYPEGLDGFAGAHRLREEAPDGLVRPGDLTTIATPIDVLGVNYYNPAGIGEPSTDLIPFDMRLIDGFPLTHFGWPVIPDALRDLLLSLHQRYGQRLPTIHVTESGCAYDDDPAGVVSGSIVDSDRIAYLDGHIRAVAEAARAGVPVRGYFVWSLMDNFEWAEGFTKRFGLVHVDFTTQARMPRASYGWYRDVISASP
jgi:beta-glucosidase